MKTKIEGTEYSLVTIRKDLLKSNTGVPVGEKEHCFSSEPLPYRWIGGVDDEDDFQVFYKQKWETAYSIDFDFN